MPLSTQMGMLGHVCSVLDLNPAIFVGCVRMGVFNSLEFLMRYLSGIPLNKEQYCFFPRDTPFSYSTKELSAISKSRHLPNILFCPRILLEYCLCRVKRAQCLRRIQDPFPGFYTT